MSQLLQILLMMIQFPKKDMGNSFEVVYLDENEKKSNLRINFLLHIPKYII